MDVLEKYHKDFNSIQNNWKYNKYIYTNLSYLNSSTGLLNL